MGLLLHVFGRSHIRTPRGVSVILRWQGIIWEQRANTDKTWAALFHLTLSLGPKHGGANAQPAPPTLIPLLPLRLALFIVDSVISTVDDDISSIVVIAYEFINNG